MTKPPSPPQPGPSAYRSARPRPITNPRRLATVILSLAAVGIVAYAGWNNPTQFRSAKEFVAKALAVPAAPPAPPTLGTSQPWDRLVRLGQRSRTSMGIVTTKAAAQTEPIRLELLGTTEYDTETLSRIRLMFKGRVDKVYTKVGETVSKGAPLIDLYSTELAEAKSNCEIERIQWLYDNNLFKIREQLIKTQSISEALFLETQNNEMKSRREYEVARDKLLIYGLNEDEVERVKDEAGSQKRRMTIRAPASGIVISRDVVVGNLYDEDDTLLVIAPLDHLWVWGNVFESDLDLVKLGQSWEVQFPFINQKLHGSVEYISNRVDPGTHAVRVRTSIPNAGGHLKSDMLVRGMLEIPPVPEWTVIPRTALVVDDNLFYVFVKPAGQNDTFERRQVKIAQEKDDHVVVERGLCTGDEVVSVGGLLLAQLYEDLKTVQTVTSTAEGSGLDEH